MKKIFLVTILLFQLTLVFGQVMQTTNGSQGLSGTAGGMQQVKQTTPSGTNSSNNGNTSNTNTNKSISIGNSNTNNEGLETVSNWIQASKCFPEIYYQVKTRYPNHPRNYKHDGTYSVWIKFKNAGGKGVKFWVKINVPNSTGGELNLNNQLAPGEVDQNAFSEVHTTAPPSSINVNIYKATYNLSTTNYIECNNGVLSNSNNLTNQTNNSTSSNTQQNDLTEYNRSKAEMEQKMQQKNQEIANRNAEAQRQQQLLKQQQEQQRQQQLQQGINQVTTATVDLVTYFANRKNALRNSLSSEDGQALIDIVNSDNPTNYTQNIIQIFKDLGYTLRETERKDNYVIITLNNDVANINDFMLIFVRPASYDYYNSIGFSYHRKQKLREQLAVLGDKLKGSDGLELQGISASNRQKKLVEDEKKLNEKTKRAKLLIDNFEKNNYWNSTDRSVFSYAKDIAEAYEDENSLNNKSEAIRYYRKAASINLDDLASPWKGDKNMRAYQQKELGKVYFKLAYLLDDDNENNGKEAIIWYLKSSEVDYSKASSNLNIARLYEGGLQGIEKDWNQAKNYYEIAADEKNKKAMNRLGQLYKTGGPNLEQDDSKSKKWFKKASK